jgi:predicted ATPase/transcriptional regulator with XRE-family HTH domain
MQDDRLPLASPSFGGLLRSHRLTCGLSQEALAERAAMSKNGVSALERGYRRTPRRETIALLTRALGLNRDQVQEFASAARSEALRFKTGGSVITGPAVDGSLGVLPRTLTSFVGREADLLAIERLVRDRGFVTITGTGGIGKTQCAIQVARALARSTRQTVCYVELAPLSDPLLVAATAASALGIREVPGRPFVDTVISYIKNKSLLLILDNCEHVLSSTAEFTRMVLSHSVSVQILATSREPLKVAGEYTYRLSSLSVPSAEKAGKIQAVEADRYEAIALFIDRARAVDHRFTLSNDNAPLIADICRRLDGIPLAIELAAGRVSLLSLSTLADSLHDGFGLLTGGEGTGLPRQRTMRATIDWSFGLLLAPEQRLFECLSIFVSGCSLSSVSAVCTSPGITEGDVMALLSSLIDKSMVIADVERDEPRYRVLESFREFGSERLETRGEYPIVALRHASAFSELADVLNYLWYNEHDQVWRTLAQEEFDNWRAALRWALTERGDISLGLRIAGQLRVLWQYLAPFEGRRWLAAARQLVDATTPHAVLADLSYAEASIAHALDEYEAVLTSSLDAVTLYGTVGDPRGVVCAQTLAGRALNGLGRIQEATSFLQTAIATGRAYGYWRSVAHALRCLSASHQRTGERSAARQCVEEALQIYKATDAELSAAFTTYELGECFFHEGDYESALAFAAEALTVFSRFGDIRVADILNQMATYLLASFRFDEAEKRAREALDFSRERQLTVCTAESIGNLLSIAILRSSFAGCSPEVHAWAAKILGFVNALFVTAGSAREYIHERAYERSMGILISAMSSDAVAMCLAEGTSLSENFAISILERLLSATHLEDYS